MAISDSVSLQAPANAALASVRPDIAFQPEDLSFSMPVDEDALARLDLTPDDTLDRAAFGIVALARDGQVLSYNKAEAALSGLDPKRVIGRRFFTSVAPCTNNFLVAHRFESEAVLDEVVDYLFTFKMAPTPVRLRLLKHPEAERMYLFVERRRPVDR
jgi:photoactive yellow protein